MESTNRKVRIYDWEGQNADGMTMRGETQATSLLLAKSELSKKGIIVKKITQRSEPLFSFANKKVKSDDVTVFTRQLSTMLQAGIPLLQAFDILAKSQTHVGLYLLINDIKKSVELGRTFAESLRQYPLLFNELYCNLIAAGEVSGSLETMLLNISSYREKIENLKRKIKKALLYPTIVLVVGVVVSAVLLIFVIPQFQSLFTSYGAQLPAFTLLVIKMSEIVRRFWLIFFVVFAGIIGTNIYFYRRSSKHRYLLDRLSLKIPVIGNVLKKAAIARFARTLSITFSAGLPLFDALKLVEGATGNMVFSEATNHIREEVATGQLMQVAMSHTGVFPNLTVQMVAIGEESGSLEEMLAKVAEYYEIEVDNVVDNLSTLIEPLIISVLGVLVGGLVVAMYLPIFKLGSVF